LPAGEALMLVMARMLARPATVTTQASYRKWR
jgi:hypothetical protein